MRSFFTLTIFTALTAAAPIAHRPSQESARHQAAQSLAGREVGIDGTCGPIWGGSTCAPGLCCSAQGYCGTSDAYCAAGCQSPFGTCGSSSSGSSAASSAPLSVPVPASSAVSLPSIVLPTSSIAAPAPTSDSAPAPVVTATSTISVLSVTPVSSAAAASTSTAALSSPSSAGSPSTNSNSGSGSSSSSTLGLGNVFKMYNGDGSSTQGWPALSNWANFDSMWTSNMEDISNSCEWSFAVPNNSDEESANLKSAIQSVAAAADMDPRFVLAIVMQESKGCVRAPTTSYSVRNPGLMQTHNGQGTCNDDGDVQNPCPAAMITQMIEDGVQGTFQKYDSSNGQGGGAGLSQALQQVGSSASGAQKYYMAARIYNSGSLSGDNLGAPGATACYAADVANRLTGWVTAPDTCDLDSYH